MNKVEKNSTAVKHTVYTSLLESIMRRGITVWGASADTHINNITNLTEMLLNMLHFFLKLPKVMIPESIFALEARFVRNVHNTFT